MAQKSFGANEGWTSADTPPPPGEDVEVDCGNFRCVAFLDTDVKWMSRYGKQKELKVIRWRKWTH
jgi:hypothetical protein